MSTFLPLSICATYCTLSAKEVLFLLSKKHCAKITVSYLHHTTVWRCLVQLCSELLWKRWKQKRGIRILYKKIRRLRMAIKYGRMFMGFNREWKSLPLTFTGTVFITAYGKRSRSRHIPMGMITPDCFGNLIVLTTFDRKTKLWYSFCGSRNDWHFGMTVLKMMFLSKWTPHFEMIMTFISEAAPFLLNEVK